MSDSESTLGTDSALLVLVVIWGVNFPVMKVLLDYLDPLALNALRFPLAAAALLLLAPNRHGTRRPSREDLLRILGLALLGHGLYQLAFIYGLDGTLAGNASLLLATTPVWALILSVASGHERAGVTLWAGVLVTLAGMILVVLGRGDRLSLGGETLTGDLLMVGAAILWAVYTVGGRRPVERYGSLRITAWTLWAGTPLVVLLGIPQLATTEWGRIPWLVWVGVVFSGVFSIGVAYLIWYRGVQAIGTARTAAYSNLVPVAAILTAWLWLGEAPSALQLVGGAVVLAGLTATRRARTTQLPDPSSLRCSTSGNS